MTEYHTVNGIPTSQKSSIKGFDTPNSVTAYSAPQGAAPDAPISDFNLKNAHQQVGGNQMSVKAGGSDVDYAEDATFFSEAGFPVTDTARINSKSVVQMGKQKMTVGCALTMGLLSQNGPGSYEISEKGYDLMGQLAERAGQTPSRTEVVDFNANTPDRDLISAIDQSLGGKLTALLMGVVSRHAQGKDGMDGSTLEMLRAKLPQADPAKLEQAISAHIQKAAESAVAFAGQQTGFTAGQVMATLEGKSANARATFLRAVVGGHPREVLQVWAAVRNGSLR